MSNSVIFVYKNKRILPTEISNYFCKKPEIIEYIPKLRLNDNTILKNQPAPYYSQGIPYYAELHGKPLKIMFVDKSELTLDDLPPPGIIIATMHTLSTLITHDIVGNAIIILYKSGGTNKITDLSDPPKSKLWMYDYVVYRISLDKNKNYKTINLKKLFRTPCAKLEDLTDIFFHKNCHPIYELTWSNPIFTGLSVFFDCRRDEYIKYEQMFDNSIKNIMVYYVFKRIVPKYIFPTELVELVKNLLMNLEITKFKKFKFHNLFLTRKLQSTL
jgi:hypothetical protein